MAFTFGFFFRWALHGQIKFVAAIALAQEPNKKKTGPAIYTKNVLRSGGQRTERRTIRNERNKKIVMTKKMKINEAANAEWGDAGAPQISESYTNGQLN